MKQIVFSILFLFFSFCLVGQCPTRNINFSTQAQVDEFLIEYPNCRDFPGRININGSVENLNGLSNITSIGGSLVISNIQNLKSFKGLENLTSIGGNIDMPHISFKNFEGLENLTSIGGDLIAWPNPLESFQGLENLTTIGGDLSAGYSLLTNFRGLENLSEIGGIFGAGFNDFLVNFEGLESLESIGESLITDGNPSLINYQGLEKLKSIGSSVNAFGNESLANFQGLENLKSIGGDFFLSGNKSLINFKGLENLSSIEGIFSITRNDNLITLSDLRNLTDVEIFVVTSNPMLTNCELSIICELLLKNLAAIEDNSTGCNSAEDLLEFCEEIRLLSYSVFYDSNQNELKDSDELLLSNFPIEIAPIGVTAISGQTTLPGQLLLESDDYTAQFVDNSDWGLTTPSSVDFSLSDSTKIAEVFFGLYPKVFSSNIVTSISSTPLRCGTEVSFNLSVKNLGTNFESGTLWLDIDPRLSDFTSNADITNGNTLGWNFQDLHPGHEFSKEVNIQIPVPPQIPVGEILKFKSYFDNGENEFEYNVEVRCAYDPNDKLVTPDRSAEYQGTAYTKFDEDLIYTVRFQNTGNAAAYDVIIRDTLDTNLDPSTFKIISSSHYEVLNVSIEDEHNVTFEFKDIFLPDSTTNFEASNGYVSYLIKTKDGLPEETPIQNTASIYFDFNPPIVTNTTENLMVTQLPTSSTNNQNEQLDIHLFPNPTDGKIYLSGVDLRDAVVSVYDLTGRLIQVEKSGANEIILPKTASGMLFLKIETEEGAAVKRVFKK